jgi:predicted ATPase/class 3 adenylate cyclase
MTGPSNDSIVFLFSDIEGSTQLWERFPSDMPSVLSRHDALLNEKITLFGGEVVKHMGDGVFAIFQNSKAIQCSQEIQKSFLATSWAPIENLKVRLALHAGHVEKRENDYFGIAINRTARILSSSWGEQIIVTPEAINHSELPKESTLLDLGKHQLKDLGQPQHLYELKYPELSNREFPPLRTLSIRPHNLPRQATEFLGRENELTEIASHLRDTPCRLLTLVGPGGIGKTRLAVQVSAEILEAFPDGVYFTPLAPISSDEFLLSTIAGALEFSFYGQDDPQQQLLSYLGEKEMLLVLDNFEHVMNGVSLLAEILSAAPKVKLLVTSRERMQINGEWVYRIHGLEIPTARPKHPFEEYSSVQLFLQGVQRVHPDYELSIEDKPHIARICELVEGLPLGIELASVWVEMLTCEEIAREIEQSRDFLETSLHDIPDRHRSLRAVFEYSWKLLSEPEREIYMKLSVFRGGFTRGAAQNIAGATLPLLTTLVHKSLLRVPSSGRYEMLEVLRSYAAEKLQAIKVDCAKVVGSHSSHYLNLLTSSEVLLKGSSQKSALDEIGREIENIREAWSFAVTQWNELELSDALNSLYLFYEMRSWFQEGEEVFGKLIKACSELGMASNGSEPASQLEAQALTRQGGFLHRLGQSAAALEILERALSYIKQSENKAELALVMNNLGNLAYTLGEFDRAKVCHTDALAWRDEIQETWGIATSLSNLGVVADRLGSQVEAKELFARSLKHRREIGDQFGIASSLNNLGVLAARLGEFDEARHMHMESLSIRREVGDGKGITESLNNLGVVADASEQYQDSKSLYEESLELSREIGDKFSSARTLNNLGIVAYNLGDFEEAHTRCLEGKLLNETIGNASGVLISLSGLGNAATAIGQYSEARDYFREALRLAVENSQLTEIFDVITGFGILMNQEGSYELAFQLFTLTKSHPNADANTRETCDHFMLELNSILPPPIKESILNSNNPEDFDLFIQQLIQEE